MGKVCLRSLCMGALVAAICLGALKAQEPKQPPEEKKDTPKKDAKKEPPKDPIQDGRPLSVWVIQLKDPDPKARQQAADSIARLRASATSATPAALEMLKDTKDAYTRQLGGYLLKYIKPDPTQALPGLVEALKDEEPAVRSEVAVALSMLGPKASSAAKDLLPLLKNKEAHVRQLTCYVLGNISPDPKLAVPPLTFLSTRDPSELVRKAALEALKKVDPTRIAPQ